VFHAAIGAALLITANNTWGMTVSFHLFIQKGGNSVDVLTLSFSRKAACTAARAASCAAIAALFQRLKAHFSRLPCIFEALKCYCPAL
jgi:hypothetical protein